MPSAHIFTVITSEGGILPTDFLAELTNPKSDIEGLDPTTYRLAPGERIGDQVNRSWNRLKGCWTNFLRSIAAKQPGEPTTTETRERWLFPLFQEMDFGRLTLARPIEIDGKSYPVSHGWGPVPIHLVGTHVDLDRRTPGAVGAAKASPHSLVQQVLNASDKHLWGIISNGFTLRLVRDNLALTRIAYLEWDLQAIFDGDLYPEFFLLWLVCHQSRFEIPPEGRADQCWLEKWKKQAAEKGLRALENLRPGVEKAIASIGAGLVSHKANQAFRSKLSSGQLSTQELYRQILRIIYRMLFLFVAEDRGLLHPPLPKDDEGKEPIEAALRARQRYRDFYSIGRLRDLTLHRAGTPHPDLCQVFQLITWFLGSDSGCPELALPALGSFLWSPKATTELNDCLISNRHFLEAAHALAFIREGNVRRAIDYKNLGSEELGSVYESLLELHPIVNADAGTFELQTAAGHERKTSGSYYTHDSLVQSLLDTALEPVIAETIRGKEGAAAAEALLNLKICDLAVGSGHFLIGAAHRLARRVASARTGEEEPSPEATRSALREVIGHCLYGVDINPMAAELCRVSLWLEALEPGKPLSFLDHHIRVGNSLLGATPELIANGLPDDAFKPIEGDDKNACAVLKKRNKAERSGIGGLFIAEDKTNLEALRRTAFALESIGDDTPEAVRRKAEAFEESQNGYDYLAAKRLADAWGAAFIIRKTFKAGTTQPFGLTQRHLNDLAKGNPLPAELGAEVERLVAGNRFFHWHLAFPEVFAKGGFDVILSNPPWEHTELKEKEWFAERRPDIAKAPTGAERKRRIEALREESPRLYQQYSDALRHQDGIGHMLGNTGLYPFCGRGRINLYAVFAERMRTLLNPAGRVGCVLQSGIATDDTTKFFFQDVVEKGSLISLFDFENKQGFFPDVDSRMSFCLFTSGRGEKTGVGKAEFVFFAHAIEDLRDPERRFTLSAEDIRLLNPNTRTCPIFRSRRDAELTRLIFRRVPVWVREDPTDNRWSVLFRQGMFNSTSDSHLFHPLTAVNETVDLSVTNIIQASGRLWLPLYEQNLVNMFDHRFATFRQINGAISATKSREVTEKEHLDPFSTAIPRFWASSEQVEDSIKNKQIDARWFIAFRRSVRSTDSRTGIFCCLPRVGIIDSVFVAHIVDPVLRPVSPCLLANLGSYALDFAFRQSIGGENASFFIMKQLPVLPPETNAQACAWSVRSQTLRDWLLPRVLELTYTAWDLEPFAQDCGWPGPPFRWDEERRFLLRCELDAAFFHLYLGSEDEWRLQPESLTRYFSTPRHAVDYIMDTFPIVKRKDEEKHGEYRTKRAILEIYDEMAEAMRTGTPYQTRLDPPPADPRCCHPPKEGTQR
jgi:hypothetical protein